MEKPHSIKETANQCQPCRESCATMIRHKARKLREYSVKLDRLADFLDSDYVNVDIDEILWSELLGYGPK